MHKKKTMSVYILSNKRRTTLYVGVSNNLPRRMIEHKLQANKKSYTAKYNLTELLYYSTSDYILGAIEEEKRIKAGSGAKKIALIESINPEWEDLSKELGITEELLKEIHGEQNCANGIAASSLCSSSQ